MRHLSEMLCLRYIRRERFTPTVEPEELTMISRYASPLRRTSVLWVTTLFSCFALAACGSSGDDEASGDGHGAATGGQGGARSGDSDGDGATMGGSLPTGPVREDEVVGPAGRPFEPEGITTQYVGKDSAGMDLVAFTLLQSYGTFEEPVFFAAVKNNGVEKICYVDLRPEFFDASGTSLATANTIVALSAPMWNSYGSPSPCLGPGEVGMGEFTNGLRDLDVSAVARIDYTIGGNITPSAEPIVGVTFSDVRVEPIYTDSVHIVGSLDNGYSQSLENPSIEAYAVDAVGRPYAMMDGIDLLTVSPGSSWNFETLSYEGEVENFVLYPDYRFP